MMSGTNSIEQGDIVFVPFPFTDLSAAKKRPALVISYDDFNKRNQDILICQITHNLNQRDHSILINNSNLEKGNLAVESLIKVSKIFTIDKTLIIQNIGKINSKTYSQVYKEICGITKPR